MLQTAKYSSSALQQRKCLRRDDSPSLFNHCRGKSGHACQAGMYQSDKCSLTQETCKPCPEGTFSPNWNNCSECLECQTCNFGVELNCTAERDAVCLDNKPLPAFTSGTSDFPSSKVPGEHSTPPPPTSVNSTISSSYPVSTGKPVQSGSGTLQSVGSAIACNPLLWVIASFCMVIIVLLVIAIWLLLKQRVKRSAKEHHPEDPGRNDGAHCDRLAVNGQEEAQRLHQFGDPEAHVEDEHQDPQTAGVGITGCRVNRIQSIPQVPRREARDAGERRN